jgi:glycosyltransferase involved in cell wall biosynthesis
MKILWLTWKDRAHPEAGGAEVVCRELTKRLVAEGHDVTLLTSSYAGAPGRELARGIDTIRVGSSRYLHPFQAFSYYMHNLRNSFDVIIEEVNAGAPYFSVLFDRRARRFLLYHQLARKNWFSETRFPLNHVGHWLLEPTATRLVGLARVPVITVSESTRLDLARHGLRPERTHVISEGIELEPVEDITKLEKYQRPTMLSLGTMRAMKRTIDQIKAFEIAKHSIPDLRLKIAGQASGAYGQKVLDYIARSPLAADIEYLGRVSREQKKYLMQRSHVITVTSVKEGWGLIVSEAASQGTPAVVYDVDGLRDSVRHNETGLTTAATPEAVADGVVRLLQNPSLYERLRTAAWAWSQQLTFDQSYQDFKTVVGVA